MSLQENSTALGAGEQREEADSAWKQAASGLAIGGLFALSMSLLLAGFLLGPALGDLGSFDRRLQIVGAAGCVCSMLAFLGTIWPAPLKRLATLLIGAGFLVALAFAGVNLARDLTLNSYNIRSHPSFALSEIAAVSPAGNERTNYRIIYTLRDRIAGGELLVHPDFPLGDWHLLYRGNLTKVSRAALPALPPAPPKAEVERWIAEGGLSLPTTGGENLIIPPVLAKQKPVDGAHYAIVKLEDGTFALVSAVSVQSK